MTGNKPARSGPRSKVFIIVLAALLFTQWGKSTRAEDVATAEKVSLTLTDGGSIQGEMLKKDDVNYYLYTAGEVLTIRQDKVEKLVGSDGREGIEDVNSNKFYFTATLPLKSTQVLSQELGSAVVTVKTPNGLGTGFFINKNGYLITNHHVVEGEKSITVTMFHKEGSGFGKKVYRKIRIVALNDNMDLALLKVEEKIDVPYAQLYLGDSDALEEGDKCFVIGNPMGLERSTSEGKISKRARAVEGRLYIQTTAPIAPGNSGGPFFNERGEVVGVVNMGYVYFDGLGFAIPSRYLKEFLDNAESFAYDSDNPNSGTKYMEAPVTGIDGKVAFSQAEFIKLAHGISCLKLADLDKKGAKEIICANNTKSEICIIRHAPGKTDKTQKNDFEDINEIADSSLYQVETLAVLSKVTSIATFDENGDGREDIIFLGDMIGLGVLEQQKDGSFSEPRRLEKVEATERADALRVADLDADGKQDIFILGEENFTIMWAGSKLQKYPIGPFAASIRDFFFINHEGDRRMDIAFFCNDKNIGARLRRQNDKREFVMEIPLRSHVSGPVCKVAESGKFLTLDNGLNRVREMSLNNSIARKDERTIPFDLKNLPVDGQIGLGGKAAVEDIDGDGTPELIALDNKQNEFVVYSIKNGETYETRSPAPRSVRQFELCSIDGKMVLFCYSAKERMFGASRVQGTKIEFPRPVAISGDILFLKLADAFGKKMLCWATKDKSKYKLFAMPVADAVKAVYENEDGTLDLKAEALKLASQTKTGEGKPSEILSSTPQNLDFADFNGDGQEDLIIYWRHTNKESLYLPSEGEGFYREVISDKHLIEENKGQPLIIEDIDQDGKKDVLLVQPDLVRVLRVDKNNELFVDRQFNWKLGTIDHMVRFGSDGDSARFLVLSGDTARTVSFDNAKGTFTEGRRIDLEGIDAETITVTDLDRDGAEDLLLSGNGELSLVTLGHTGAELDSRLVLSENLDRYMYWNMFTADIDGKAGDEVMLFDSRKGMMEIYRHEKNGKLKMILRNRLFEKTISQRSESDSFQIPSELCVGDVDSNGKQDFISILMDRIAIYLQ